MASQPPPRRYLPGRRRQRGGVAAAQLRDQRPVLGARVVRHVVPAVRRVADDEVRVEHGRVAQVAAVPPDEQPEGALRLVDHRRADGGRAPEGPPPGPRLVHPAVLVLWLHAVGRAAKSYR